MTTRIDTTSSADGPSTAYQRLTPPGADTKRSGVILVVVGVLIFGVALTISLVTYSNAANSAEGGTYFVAWGPALLGVVLLFVGISRLVKGNAALRPQWQPDPTGRHQHRYWDGNTWTDQVADAGEESRDPVEALPRDTAQASAGSASSASRGTQPTNSGTVP
jgi:hypothetical protein